MSHDSHWCKMNSITTITLHFLSFSKELWNSSLQKWKGKVFLRSKLQSKSAYMHIMLLRDYDSPLIERWKVKVIFLDRGWDRLSCPSLQEDFANVAGLCMGVRYVDLANSFWDWVCQYKKTNENHKYIYIFVDEKQELNLEYHNLI